jgi:hypothetical protein
MKQPATHLALPLPLAKRVRQILGKMEHDLVRELLFEFDSSPTVNLNTPAPAPALAPAPSEDSKDE